MVGYIIKQAYNEQFMYNSLKKYGLSDTKHEIKFHLDNCSPYRSTQKKIQPKEPSSNFVTVSNFTLDEEMAQKSQEKKLVLDYLLSLIERRERQPCLLKGHDRNPKRFICLEGGCLNRIGCSYCFLEYHKNHEKTDARQCLGKLGGIKAKVEMSRSKLKEMLGVRKAQAMRSMKFMMDQVRQAFDREMKYLQKKIEDSLQAEFSQKMAQLQGQNLSLSRANAFRVEEPDLTFATEKMESQVKKNQEMSIDDIFDLFNGTGDCKRQQGEYSKRKSKNASKYQSKVLRDHNKSFVSKGTPSAAQEEVLLEKLSRMNLVHVEEYLHQEAFEMKECVEYLKVYEQFYKQLHTSLDEFFTTFKCALPCYRSIEISLAEPQILRGCSF